MRHGKGAQVGFSSGERQLLFSFLVSLFLLPQGGEKRSGLAHLLEFPSFLLSWNLASIQIQPSKMRYFNLKRGWGRGKGTWGNGVVVKIGSESFSEYLFLLPSEVTCNSHLARRACPAPKPNVTFHSYAVSE